MAREEAEKATTARCSGLAARFICLAKWPERLGCWGVGRGEVGEGGGGLFSLSGPVTWRDGLT